MLSIVASSFSSLQQLPFILPTTHPFPRHPNIDLLSLLSLFHFKTKKRKQPQLESTGMADTTASPPTRGGSPPPRKRSRSAERSLSPYSKRSRGQGRDQDRDRDRDRRRDGFRPRDGDERRRDSDRDYDSNNRGRREAGGDDGRDSRRRDAGDERRDDGRERDRPRQKKGSGGFRYKEKRRDDDADDRDRDRDERRGASFRGYRQRSRSPRRQDRERDRDAPTSSSSASKKSKSKTKDSGDDTSKPPARAAPSSGAVASQPMIIVHVNDRLGTKAAIPCLASDSIRDFKIMVAARIGREPHEIMLKRQGMRPFKDMLTLADYEISNGVQLDLEVDTGD